MSFRRGLFSVMAAAALLLMAMPATAQEQQSYIQVEGRAEREVLPDEFWLSIAIDEEDSRGRVPLEQQQSRMFSTLSSLGVDIDKQLSIVRNSSEYFKRGSLSKAIYELKLNSSESLFKVWSALSELNLSEVSLKRVGCSNIEDMKREIRREAILNAKACAEELAEAVGQSVGRCFMIVDWNNDISPSFYDNMVMMRSKGSVTVEESAVEPTLPEFKAIKLRYSVQTKFELN